MSEQNKLYREMLRIRRFEETVLDEFSSGVFYGTTHTYIGQEANAVGVLRHLGPEDIVFSNHRCHGHFIAYGGEMRALYAELMGRPSGVSGGRGGSQHIHWRNFFSNGIQGSTIPIATGTALAEKRKGSDAVTIAFLGDGTLGEGTVYESLNMASLWRAPILYVLENNHIAQTTPTEMAIAGSMAARFEAFGIPTAELDSSDVLAISALAQELIGTVRAEAAPRALVLHTQRFSAHSKGDDSRDPTIVAALRETRDPLTIHGARLTEADRDALLAEVNEEVQSAFQAAQSAPQWEPTA